MTASKLNDNVIFVARSPPPPTLWHMLESNLCRPSDTKNKTKQTYFSVGVRCALCSSTEFVVCIFFKVSYHTCQEANKIMLRIFTYARRDVFDADRLQGDTVAHFAVLANKHARNDCIVCYRVSSITCLFFKR